jgi:cytochrome o ubiquinol oxidase subunit 2
VAKVKQQGTMLNRDAYLKLEKPSEKDPVRYYAGADADLYTAILNMCATPGKMCMNEMMHIDMMGGGGKESAENREKLQYDNRHAGEGVVAPAATVPATGAPARSEPDRSTDGNSMQHDMPGMQHDMPGMQGTPGTDSTPGTGMQHDGHSMPGMSNGADPAPAQLNNNN